MRRITNNYSTCIGEGGFGKVYKGVLPDDYDLVAVKIYKRKELRERERFMDEVRIHSRIKHKNVVKLIGYCISESNLMLITEYISKGNLNDILHNSGISISLDTRLGIAIGRADALSYMHLLHLSSGGNLIYHGDIKSANILLDDNFTAKVSDFGLSRLLSGGITQYTSKVVGSIYYMDPVCFQTGYLTPRSDVYSFGIVLLELIAKRANQDGFHLTGAFANANRIELRELFDSAITNENDIGILPEMVKLANECLSLVTSQRPKMIDVAERLWVLKRNVRIRKENTRPRSILETHYSWYKKDKQEKVQLKKSSSFLKRNASNNKILLELKNVTRFTKEELNDVTKNYSCLLGGDGTPAKFYKGILEDNTAVVVWKFLYADSEETFINGGIILSQIFHKNIIKLLGCCLEAETLILVYEYASKGSLIDILGSQEDLPLDIRLRIAIKTAEALQYLHSAATGIIGHGSGAASTILLDNNFSPKLTDFSRARNLIKESEITVNDGVITRNFLEKVLYNNPVNFMSVLMNLESDVYRFGCVLFALISRDNTISLDGLVSRFTEAYRTDNTGKAIFDKVITAEEEINVLEDLGRLALKCTILNVDEMVNRPTMKEVVEQLHMIRRSWMEHTTEATTTQVTKIQDTVMPIDQPRLPNLMRHLYGYRRIQW